MARPDLSGCRLYGILDLGYISAQSAPEFADKLIAGGVDVVQLRAKSLPHDAIEQLARELLRRIDDRVPLIINDHPLIARAVGAAGVHVGQDDGSIHDARSLAGAECIVGRSTHSIKQAVRAAEEGADYIGFGPLFATPTKPEYEPIGLSDIAEVHRRVRIPIFCIGGVKLENLAQVIAAGARRVVIVSGLLNAADIAEYARRAKQMLCQF